MILFQVSIDIKSSSKPEMKLLYRVDTTKVVHIKAEQSYVFVMTEETVRHLSLPFNFTGSLLSMFRISYIF